MHYFAYGANLDRRQLKTRCPGCKPGTSAMLHHYRLVFSGWSRQWRGGVASIKPMRGEHVRGGLYELSEAEMHRLDEFEGCPAVYDRINIIVNTDDGDSVEAFTYIRKQQTEETKPSPEYLKIIQQGYRDWGLI